VHSLTAIPGEEAVLVSMKKAIDICVYYTLGREAKVRRLAYKDQVRRQRCCLLRAPFYTTNPPNICQDRLGTNIGKAVPQKRGPVVSQIWESSPPPPGQQFDSAVIPPSDIVQSCCPGATTMLSVREKKRKRALSSFPPGNCLLVGACLGQKKASCLIQPQYEEDI